LTKDRQASIHFAKLGRYDIEYHYGNIRKNPPAPGGIAGGDIQAFKIALARAKGNKNELLFDLMTSGDLPGNTDEIKKYLEVYLNGMKEVDNFFQNK
jgi:hypothetical protein